MTLGPVCGADLPNLPTQFYFWGSHFLCSLFALFVNSVTKWQNKNYHNFLKSCSLVVTTVST